MPEKRENRRRQGKEVIVIVVLIIIMIFFGSENVTDIMPRAPSALSHSILPTAWQGKRSYHSHFIDDKTEV